MLCHHGQMTVKVGIEKDFKNPDRIRYFDISTLVEDDNSNCSVYYDISYFLCRNIYVCVCVSERVGWVRRVRKNTGVF